MNNSYQKKFQYTEEVTNMENLGKSLRLIRKGRNITIKQAVKDVCSQAQLSTFENGDSQITLKRFYGIIKNLGITLEEFEYIANDYNLDNIHSLLKNIRDAYNHNNVEELKKILDIEIGKEEDGLHHELNCLMIKNLIAELTLDFNLSSDEKQKITNYLGSIDYWGWYELNLYNNTMRSFDPKIIVNLSEEALKRSNYYKDVPRNKKLIGQTLLNTMIILIGYNEIKMAKKFIALTTGQLAQEDIFEKTILLFISGAIAYYDGKIDIGKKKMKNSINIFNVVGSRALADAYKISYNNIINNQT